MPRFLVRNLRPGEEVELPPAESAHARTSLRPGPGDAVTLFDGRGSSCEGRIVRVEGNRVIVKAGPAETRRPGREVPAQL